MRFVIDSDQERQVVDRWHDPVRQCHAEAMPALKLFQGLVLAVIKMDGGDRGFKGSLPNSFLRRQGAEVSSLR